MTQINLTDIEVFREIQLMEQYGNFNALILKTVEHFADLTFVRPELLEKISHYLKKQMDLTSPFAVQALSKIPKIHLQHYGLAQLLKSYKSRLPKPRIGCIHFPVVTSSVGIVSKIQVADKEASDMPEWKLKFLEQVGSPTFSALRQKLGRLFLWYPEQYHFNVLDHFENEDNDVKGYSLGLPLALALYSHVTKLPVPTDLSATGDVKSNGTIKPVECIDEKIEALSRERYFIKRVLVSHDQQLQTEIPDLKLVRVKTVKDAIAEAFPDKIDPLSFHVQIDIQKEKDRIADQYRKSLYTACIDNSESLIKYLASKKGSLADSALIVTKVKSPKRLNI